jgi:putative DNA primase/helicase
MSRADSSTADPNPYHTVPPEVKGREQWLLWDRSSDTPKQPHWKGNFAISWSNPDEWHTFEQAVSAAQTHDSWGIGYVTAFNNPDCDDGKYAVLDVDGPYDESGDLRSWVPPLDRFNGETYIERTPNNGLHIVVDGRAVPEWWTDCEVDPELHQGVDVLSNKFCTVTGNTHCESADTIGSVNPAPWLFEAHKRIRGDTPTLGESGRSADDDDADEWLTDSDVADALDKIDPDVPHSEWIQLAYAVHDYDDGSTGQRLFEKWSKDGSKWDKAAARSVEAIWSSASKGSGVSVATLVHKAKENGWNPRPSGASKSGTNTEEEHLAEAVDSGWFDTTRQVVEVQRTADCSITQVADKFRNPDALSREATVSIYEIDGGAEFLSNPDEWQVRSGRGDPLAELTAQELKNTALRDIPTERVAYLPKREEWFWCDESGVWQQHGEEDIRQWLDEYLGSHYRRSIRTEVQDQLKARVRSREEAFGGGPPGTIATQSGLVDLESEECREIEPSDKVRWQLGTEFDPEANCPAWKRFVGSVTEPGDIKILQEFVGYCLHHWGLPFKKALILFGPTDAGKSVFLNVIRALFGGDESPATSSTSVQYLANERWGAARLVNTAVNIRNDLDGSTIKNTGKVKELIAGDALDAERKRKPVFKFSPTAKHCFAANRAPDRSVDDEAFWNRWITVMFPESVPRDKQDPTLESRLIDELPGILNWAIEGYQRLMSQRKFTDEPLPFENREKWERFGSSIEQWINQCTEEQADAIVPKWSTDSGTLGAYDSYKAFARRNGLEIESDSAFTSKLKQREGVGKTKRTIDNNQQQAYSGFELTRDAPRPEQSESADGTPTGLKDYGDSYE